MYVFVGWQLFMSSRLAEFMLLVISYITLKLSENLMLPEGIERDQWHEVS